jgi:hypothetical protein
MPFTDLASENPFKNILPLEIWLLIRKYKIQFELADISKELDRKRRLISAYHHELHNPFTVGYKRRQARRFIKNLKYEMDIYLKNKQ